MADSRETFNSSKPSLFSRLAEKVINGPVGGAIFRCNTSPSVYERRSLCTSASEEAQLIVSKIAESKMPAYFAQPVVSDLHQEALDIGIYYAAILERIVIKDDHVVATDKGRQYLKLLQSANQ